MGCPFFERITGSKPGLKSTWPARRGGGDAPVPNSGGGWWRCRQEFIRWGIQAEHLTSPPSRWACCQRAGLGSVGLGWAQDSAFLTSIRVVCGLYFEKQGSRGALSDWMQLGGGDQGHSPPSTNGTEVTWEATTGEC